MSLASGLFVLFSLCHASYSGTICLSCNNLAEDELCTGVEMCKNNEVCFIQNYTTNGNEYRYDVGCAYPELCRKDLTGHVLGRRSDHSHLLCHKCCNKSDICNARLSCNDKISVSQQMCSSCSEIEDPRLCKNTTICAKDEICYLHKYTTHLKQQLYNLGCKHSALCTHGYTNILGRRLSLGVHQECESCCSGTALCNRDLQCDHTTQKSIHANCSSAYECIGSLVCLSGKCQCPSDEYYWNINSCIERKSENERCSGDSHCKTSLQCQHNTCKCINTQYWNGFLCISKKSYNSTCVSSAECLGTLYCTHGQCNCDRADYWSGSLCSQKKGFNSTCNTTYQCENPFRCINNVCRCIQPEYWDGRLCVSKKLECEDIEETNDGVYFIYPGGGDTAVAVYCIMRQAKKWTVIQRRANGSVDFYRTWLEYKMGFGSAYGEYWLGNDNINLISTNKHHELSIYMQTASDNRTANYSTFFVENEGSKYRLAVTGYSGDAGDSMNKNGDSGKSNEQQFTTKDRDNDNEVFYNCAEKYISGWWFNSCYSADFNRAYSGQTGHMYWASWSSDISKSILMIRRTS